MSKWQPIETSPRSDFHNPVRLILWLKNAGVAFGKVYDDYEGGFIVVADGYHGNWEATRWMPLPPPPENE
jgi:hypothetical protein